MRDHLGSSRVAPLFFEGHPKNLMLLFTVWLMHDLATQECLASLAALLAPFCLHVFRDNPSERPRLREVAQEKENSGTDYEHVIEKTTNYIVRSPRNRGGKIVARRVEENEESNTDSKPVVEEATHRCSEASKPSRERK